VIYSAAAPNRAQDRLNEAVLVTRWGSATRLYALTRKGVYFFERNAAAAWTMTQLYDQEKAHKNWKGKVPAGEIPADLPLTAFAVHETLNGKGTLYVGTSGAHTESHVWWFDGVGTWVGTGLKLDSPVYALAVDPLIPEVVYAGTDEGVWKGRLNALAAGGRAWTWTRYSTGLPEAPCVDLLISAPETGQQRFLRAALAGRGVWEVAVGAHMQAPDVYLRSHAYEARRAGVPAGGPRSPFVDPEIVMYTSAHPQVRLDASPDIRVWRAAAAAAPSPVRLPVVPAAAGRPLAAANFDAFDAWLLRSALRARGEDVDPDGDWTSGSDAALLNQRNALFPAAAPTDAALWTALVAGNALACDNTPPDHADAARHVPDEPDRWLKGTKTSCACTDSAQVMVTVHSRHWRAVPKDSVRVVLLNAQYATSAGDMFGRRDASSVPPLPAGWDASLVADQAAPNGNWMGAGGVWSYADAVPFRALPADLGANNPQVVTFNVNFAAADARKWEQRGWLLLAVVLSTDDPLVRNPPVVAETDVAKLVRKDPHVAARSVRKAVQLAEPISVYAGIDVYAYPPGATMDLIWSRSNIMWTGLWLARVAQAPTENPEVAYGGAPAGPFSSPTFTSGCFIVPPTPAPPGLPAPPPRPVLDVFRGHADQSWQNRWRDIVPHFGVMPMYFGHQDPHNVEPDTAKAFDAPVPLNTLGWRPKGPFDLRKEIGEDNAADAVVKARIANIPPGAVIYLDWEWGNLNWVLSTLVAPITVVASAKEYCVAFFRKLTESGYRPGVYCRAAVSPILREECPGLFVWHVGNANPMPNPPVHTAVGAGVNQLFLDTTTAFVDSHPQTIARQWRLDYVPPANPTTLNVGIDLNISIVEDPAFPERRLMTQRVSGGKVSVTASAPAACAIYSVRAGRPVVATWSPGASGARAKPVDDQLPHAWNPYSVPAAVRIPATPLQAPLVTPDPTDLFLALASSTAEGREIWRLQALRRAPGRQWERNAGRCGISDRPAARRRGDETIGPFHRSIRCR
jgi:hypothetical protein